MTTTDPFDKESPISPEKYVDTLLATVKEMATNASPDQWKKLGIVARNIERSHNHYLSTAVTVIHAKNETIEELKKQLLQVKIDAISKDMKSLRANLREKGQEMAALKREQEALNTEN